ncbi:hypothetical protein [Haloplanus sp.]|uniref:hypothetical protein n=1 Tax=Haloplanus sp. TaxID=1961696 RepID=UPI00262FF2D0|nr:hypothetical protein [Haloplanus sp.]
MSLFGKLLSLFRGGSSADAVGSDPGPEPESDPEPEPDPTEAEDPETETDGEEAETEDEADEAEDEAMHSGELAAAADPRRDPAQNDTVADRAANPDDHAA